MTNDVINKYLAERTGECWHEIHRLGTILEEYGCPCSWSGYERDAEKHLKDNHNPNYFTPSGFFKLLEYMKGREDGRKFHNYTWRKWFGEVAQTIVDYEDMRGLEWGYTYHSIPLSYLDPTTFPTLCYEWLKGESK